MMCEKVLENNIKKKISIKQESDNDLYIILHIYLIFNTKFTSFNDNFNLFGRHSISFLIYNNFSVLSSTVSLRFFEIL